MSEIRRKYDPEFREGAVRIVRETGKPIAHVADDLGVNPGTLGNWVKKDRIERGEADEGLDIDERSDEAGRRHRRVNRRRRRRPAGGPGAGDHQVEPPGSPCSSATPSPDRERGSRSVDTV